MPKCPSCGHDGAYFGFRAVECLNFDCENFSSHFFNEEQNRYDEEMLRQQAEIDASEAASSGCQDVASCGVCPPPLGKGVVGPAGDVNNCNIDGYDSDAMQTYDDSGGNNASYGDGPGSLP
jgi:hypothetical protein